MVIGCVFFVVKTECLNIIKMSLGFRLMMILLFHFHQPCESINWELQLRVSCCREPLSLATWKALVLINSCLKSPMVKQGRLMLNKSVEAAPYKVAELMQHLVSNTISYPDWGFPSFSSLIRKIPGYYSKGAWPIYPQSWSPSAKMTPPPQTADNSPISISTSSIIVYKHCFPVTAILWMVLPSKGCHLVLCTRLCL
jgi:hypothetical protein